MKLECVPPRLLCIKIGGHDTKAQKERLSRSAITSDLLFHSFLLLGGFCLVSLSSSSPMTSRAHPSLSFFHFLLWRKQNVPTVKAGSSILIWKSGLVGVKSSSRFSSGYYQNNYKNTKEVHGALLQVHNEKNCHSNSCRVLLCMDCESRSNFQSL